jgi:hypothetical protein
MSYKFEKKESVMKEALEHEPKLHKVPKTHKEIVNKISNKKFH